MNTEEVHSNDVVIPPDFDEVLGPLYGVVHPEDVTELACNLAALLENYDVPVRLMEEVLIDKGLIELTSVNARQFAEAAVRFRRACG